jgi:hypothetical protein
MFRVHVPSTWFKQNRLARPDLSLPSQPGTADYQGCRWSAWAQVADRTCPDSQKHSSLSRSPPSAR